MILDIVYTPLGDPKPKRRFYYQYYAGVHSPGTIAPPLKDGEIEVFEDFFSLPDTKVEVFEGEVKTEEYIISARYAENHKNLTLRSLLTGRITTFCKWPNDYFGDKGRGPFSSFKKAVELGPLSRTLKFDCDGKKM